MSRVTTYGLPASVDSVDSLPSHAYDGHLCYVKGVGEYVFNGTEYESITVSSDDSGSSDDETEYLQLTVYATVSGATDPLPADAEEGGLAYVSSTHAAYVKTNSGWSKLNPTADVIIATTVADTEQFPATPAAGQLVWVTDATDIGLYVYNGAAWKKVTIAE